MTQRIFRLYGKGHAEGGFLLPQVIIFSSVAILLSQIVSQTLLDTIFMKKVADLRQSTITVRMNLQSFLSSDLSWRAIIYDPDNEGTSATPYNDPIFFKCVQFASTQAAGIDCRGRTGVLKIVDASGAEYFDPTKLDSGFSFNGGKCDADCTLGATVTWSAVNCPAAPAPCYTPSIQIDVVFKLRKDMIGSRLVPFNPTRTSFSMVRNGGFP